MTKPTGGPSRDIVERIGRLYAAIGETIEDDLSKFAPVTDPSKKYFRIEFSGGMSEAQMANRVHLAVAQVAGLRDPLKKWAKGARHDKRRVDAVVKNSSALQILTDLWNSDKHGPSSRETLSGKGPKLVRIDRGLAISPQQHGKGVALTLSPTGLEVHGPASRRVMVDGAVVAEDGSSLGVLSRLLEQGMDAWEELLKEWRLL